MTLEEVTYTVVFICAGLFIVYLWDRKKCKETIEKYASYKQRISECTDTHQVFVIVNEISKESSDYFSAALYRLPPLAYEKKREILRKEVELKLQAIKLLEGVGKEGALIKFIQEDQEFNGEALEGAFDELRPFTITRIQNAQSLGELHRLWEERRVENDSSVELASLHESKFTDLRLREALSAKSEEEKCFEHLYFDLQEEKDTVLIRLKKTALEFKNGLGKPECYTNNLIASVDRFIKIELSGE